MTSWPPAPRVAPPATPTPAARRPRRAVRAALAAALAAGACARPAPPTLPPPAPVPLPALGRPAPCCSDSLVLATARRVAERYRVAALATRRFTHAELRSALAPIERAAALRVTEIGRSVEGRPIRAFTFGTGPTTVLLWSQMHGDESTATMALADLLAWFGDEAGARGDDETPEDAAVRDRLAAALTVVMVPMLNPDGANRDRRANAVGVDLNRDARRLAAPEARALKALGDSLRPAFAFNLHDQSPRVLTAPGGRQVAVALLAPPADETRSWGHTRALARRLAAEIAGTLEREVPGRVARYDDTYNPHAFGDLMQQRGTSTVLIESGALPDDPEKQRLRALNVVAIFSALDAIAHGRHLAADPLVYDALPRNGRAAADVLVRGARLVVPGAAPARVDVALEYDDPLTKSRPRVSAAGALPGVVALDTVDAAGLFLHPAPAMLEAQDGAYRLRVNAPAALTVRRSRERGSAVVWTIGASVSRGTAARGRR